MAGNVIPADLAYVYRDLMEYSFWTSFRSPTLILVRIRPLEGAQISNLYFGAKISKLNFGANRLVLKVGSDVLTKTSRQNIKYDFFQPRPQVPTDSTSSPGHIGWSFPPEIDSFCQLNLWAEIASGFEFSSFISICSKNRVSCIFLLMGIIAMYHGA